MENVGVIDKDVFIKLFYEVVKYDNHVGNIDRTLFEEITRKKGWFFRRPCTYAEHYRWKYDGWAGTWMIVKAAFEDGVISQKDYDVWVLDDLADDLWREVGSFLKDDVQYLYVKHETARLLRKVQKLLKELKENQCE